MISLSQLLDHAPTGELEPHPELWGFGGLHGGLTLALMTSAMSAAAPDVTLRAVSASYHRAIRTPFRITVDPIRAGRTVATTAATASTAKGAHVTASATFGADARSARPVLAPAAPDAAPPDELDVFTIPVEFVPFAAFTEIRPVGPNRPFAGGDDPTLTAWIRLVEDDRPPDLARLVVLVDALAPSYGAVLPAPQLIPTMELSVRPGPALAQASSPWVLLHARTLGADASGWVDERIDVWGPDGGHLGSAHQLRLVVAG